MSVDFHLLQGKGQVHPVWTDSQTYFRYLAIYNYENWPKSIQIVPKWVHNTAKYQTNPKNFAKQFKIFVNLAKIRQIWLHFVHK